MILWTVMYPNDTQWCATQAQAKAAVRELCTTGITYRRDCTVQPVTIPTNGREALAEWLNERGVRG